MDEVERCLICSNKITKVMVICPNCGCVIERRELSPETHNRYNYNKDKNLEYLDKLDLALSRLEQELDAFLCKKR